MKTGESCLFCGGEEWVEILEAWEDRAWMIETCCEGSHELFAEDLASWPEETLVELFAEAGIGIRRAIPDPWMLEATAFPIDWGIHIGPIEQLEAKSFVREHHGHANRPPVGWRWGHGIFNGRDLIGVVMVGRPVARRLDPTRVVEVNRLCIRRDFDHRLTWKAASAGYRAAELEARARGFERIITYTTEQEHGRSLRYARWKPEARSRGAPGTAGDVRGTITGRSAPNCDGGGDSR